MTLAPRPHSQMPQKVAPQALGQKAATLAAGLPPLLSDARHLADTVMLGDHGRRRAGQGDAFWQFRPAQPGDPAHRIDWRRSARSDQAYIRDREWQAAQTITLWVDPALSMRYGSDANGPSKSTRATVIALAAAMLFLRAGERVGFLGSARAPLRAEATLPDRLTDLLAAPEVPKDLRPRGRAIFLTDGLGDPNLLDAALSQAASRKVHGALLQILDPAEQDFPFAGRSLFQDMGAVLEMETQEAADLRAPYLKRLAARKDALAAMCRRRAWAYHCHDTSAPPSHALLWLYHALEARR